MDLARRAKSIFLDALDAPSHEREALLVRECAADASLRARVDALLSAHVRAESAGMTLAPMPADLVDPEGSPGARIGPYLLERELGCGGFGTVWLARQLEPIERPVALKLLKAGMDTREVIARFALERRTLARMEHPGIAHILDAGATPQGRPWFAMEHVDGPPITVHADRAGLSTRERVELFLPLCRAVQHAHQKGVVHRDIKPTNVLVATVEGRAHPKVIDFGIAKAVAGDVAEHHTHADQIVGTPAWMAPEQLTGGMDIDTRADVYGLGALLYDLLVGAPPHELHDAANRPRTPAAVRELVLSVATRRPSVRLAEQESLERRRTAVVNAGATGSAIATDTATARTSNAPRTSRRGPRAREVRGELDWIVMRCLERDRERRYDSVASLAADLERYLQGHTVLAGPPSVAYRTSRFVRRHYRSLTVVVLLFAALVGALVLIENEADRARRAESNSVLEADRARIAEQHAKDELVRADAVARFLEDLLLSVDPATAQGRDTSLLVEMLARAERHLATEADSLRPDVEASLRRIVGGANFTLARYETARPHLERALELRRAHLGAEHAETLQSEAELAPLLAELGFRDESLALLARTAAAHRTHFGERDSRTLLVLANQATLLQQLGHTRDAEPLLRELEKLHLEIHGPDHPQTVTAINNLAILLEDLGDLEGAETRFRAAHDHQLQTNGPSHPRTLTAANNLASILERRGETAKAAALHEEVLTTKRTVLPPGHPSLIVSLNNVASLRDKLGEHEAAEALRLEALATAEAHLGHTHRNTITVRFTHAQQLADRGLRERALEQLTTVFALAPEHMGADHPVTLAAQSLYGWTLHEHGDSAAGEPLARRAADRARELLPFGDKARATYVARAALVQAAIGGDTTENARALAAALSECEQSGLTSWVERLTAAGGSNE